MERNFANVLLRFLVKRRHCSLRFLDPVQFQLLGNLKILTTTLLFRVIMKKPLSDLAYVSLLLLTVGLTFSQLKSEEQVSITPQALIIMGSIAMLSGLAGIVTEVRF